VLKLSNIAVGNRSLEEVVDAQIIREVSEETMALGGGVPQPDAGGEATMKDVEVRLQLLRGVITLGRRLEGEKEQWRSCPCQSRRNLARPRPSCPLCLLHEPFQVGSHCLQVLQRCPPMSATSSRDGNFTHGCIQPDGCGCECHFSLAGQIRSRPVNRWMWV
jgi:hypothetical protein